MRRRPQTDTEVHFTMRKTVHDMSKQNAVFIGALVASLAFATSASAAGTYNGTSGFVGKGDVQTAFNMNNSVIQTTLIANPKAFTFSSTQATTQSLTQAVTESGVQSGTQTGTQSGTQAGVQSGTQDASWLLSCTYDGKNRVFHNYGTRNGTREGSREVSREVSRDVTRDVSRSGSRTGSRAGVINGSIAASIAGDPRQTKGQNQFTGFNLKALTVTGTTTDPAVWNAPVMNDDFTSSDEWTGAWSGGTYVPSGNGEYTFTTGYTFGDVEWSGWDAAPGENPADCLRTDNAGAVTDLVNVVTDGTIHDGAITDGAYTDGAIAGNEVIPTGVLYSGNVVANGAIAYGPVVAGAYKLFVSLNGGAPKAL
jgi:hypothetical protein